MILFDCARVVHPSTFAAGLIAPAPSPALAPKPRRSRPDRLDVAWYLGFNSCLEEGPTVLPPAHFSTAERDAFDAGVSAAVMGAADPIDELIDQLQAEAEDAAACGFSS